EEGQGEGKFSRCFRHIVKRSRLAGPGEEEAAMAKVLVTGGSGKLGRAVLKDLVTNGYAVLNVDQAPPRDGICPFVRAELTDFGQVVQLVTGSVDERGGPFDAVVHLAAIPAPGLQPNARTFANNVNSSYNVFEACRIAGVKNIVFASSETVLG